MSIDDSFYKNVFLLMQTVPASFECTKHFRKGMFTKSNTLGFIYLSHYLLSVYDAKRFLNMVKWPIMNKTDEKQYRTEIKQYLEIIRDENPDINFPTILISYLLQAGGLKFLIIMWKISEISLRAYIVRQYQIILLKAPNMTNINDITKTFFTNINLKRDRAISEFSEKNELILQSFEHYLKTESNDLKEVQTHIFEAKDNIKKIIHEAPVNSLIAKRLADIEDSEIIDQWKINICHNIKFLREKDAILKNLTTMSNILHSLISNLCIRSTILDGNNLPKVNNKVALSFLNNNMQHSHGLYRNNCLVLHVLLSILNEILKQVHCYLKPHRLLDLSADELKINECCEAIKSMEKMFQYRIEQISNISHSIKCSLKRLSLNNTLQTDFHGSMSQEMLSHSTEFNFSDSNYINIENLLENLYFSPIKGKYKHLFKRHKRNLFNSPKQSISKLQFNDSIESITSWRSPQRQSFIHKTYSPNRTPVSPRYSRLFSSNELKRNYSRGNIVVSTPKPIQTNETLERTNIEMTAMQTINIEAAMKNIFDLSNQITNVVTSLCKSESKSSSML